MDTLWSEDELIRNFTNANQSDLCQVKHMGPVFYLLSALFSILATVGIIGNAFLMLILPKAHLLHKNVRYMMVNVTAAALIICIYCGGRSVYNFLIISKMVSLSTPTSAFKCSLIEMIGTTAEFFMVLCIFGIGAERLYATWKRASSDQISGWLPKMIIGLWTAASLTSFIQAGTASHSPTLCYCHTILSFHEIVLFFTCAAYFLVEIPALIMYFIIRRWNRTRLGSYGANLSERFQTWNTLRATEMLLASVVTHGVCLSIVEIGSFVAHLFYFSRSDVNEVDVTSLNVLHAITLFIVLHAASHPYISMWRSEHLTKHAKRRIKAIFGKKTSVNLADVPGTAVFDIGQKTSNCLYEPIQQTTSFAVESERPLFVRPPRVPDKARQRMGVPNSQRTPVQEGPAYQVYQITPEQSAALLKRFWR